MTLADTQAAKPLKALTTRHIGAMPANLLLVPILVNDPINIKLLIKSQQAATSLQTYAIHIAIPESLRCIITQSHLICRLQAFLCLWQ